MVQNLQNYNAGKTPVTLINVPIFQMFVPWPFPVVTQYLYAGEWWDTILMINLRISNDCAPVFWKWYRPLLLLMLHWYIKCYVIFFFFWKMDSDLILRNTHVRQKLQQLS